MRKYDLKVCFVSQSGLGSRYFSTMGQERDSISLGSRSGGTSAWTRLALWNLRCNPRCSSARCLSAALMSVMASQV